MDRILSVFIVILLLMTCGCVDEGGGGTNEKPLATKDDLKLEIYMEGLEFSMNSSEANLYIKITNIVNHSIYLSEFFESEQLQYFLISNNSTIIPQRTSGNLDEADLIEIEKGNFVVASLEIIGVGMWFEYSTGYRYIDFPKIGLYSAYAIFRLNENESLTSNSVEFELI